MQGGGTNSQNISEMDYAHGVEVESIESDNHGMGISSSFNIKPNSEKIKIGNRSLGINNIAREQKID